MSRFYRWSGASMTAFNWNADMFMKNYHDNLNRSYIAALDTSPFTAAIIKMFKDEPDKDWNGTPDGLREHLEDVMYDNPIIRSKYWVKPCLISKGWFITTSVPRVEPPPGGVSQCKYVREGESLHNQVN